MELSRASTIPEQTGVSAVQDGLDVSSSRSWV